MPVSIVCCNLLFSYMKSEECNDTLPGAGVRLSQQRPAPTPACAYINIPDLIRDLAWGFATSCLLENADTSDKANSECIQY